MIKQTLKNLLFAIALVSSIGLAQAQTTAKNTTASFPGGMDALGKFLGKNLHYPKANRATQVQGKVFVSFNVEEDGSLTDIRIARGIGNGCDEEALRVMKLSPKWIPGKVDGSVVRQAYTIPIMFQAKS